jgi:hypothetical protein
MEELVTEENIGQVVEVIKQAMGALCEMSQSLWEVMIKNEYIMGTSYACGAFIFLIGAIAFVGVTKYCYKRKRDVKQYNSWEVGIIIGVLGIIGTPFGVWICTTQAVKCFLIPEYNIFIKLLNYVR